MNLPDNIRSHVRRFAALAVIALLGGSLLVLYRAAAEWDLAPTPPATPYRLSRVVAPAFAARVWGGNARPGHPQVVLYIQETCTYCQAELGHWSALSRINGTLIHAAELVVLSSDSGAVADSHDGPESLEHRRLYDLDGEIARELAVGAVPYTLYIDADGIVRASTLGETSVATIRANIESLLREQPQ